MNNVQLTLIVLFKSLRNCKRRKKENLTLKSNSNMIKLCEGRGQHYPVLNKFSKVFKVSLHFLSELNNIFHVKGLKRFTFLVKLIDDTRKT